MPVSVSWNSLLSITTRLGAVTPVIERPSKLAEPREPALTCTPYRPGLAMDTFWKVTLDIPFPPLWKWMPI
jgi:hypothetical protein